jgi:ubiquitin C-terminal hydrolase
LLRNQEFQNNIGSNISLAQCFYYYQKEKSCKCPICQSSMSKEQSKILFSTKVLILRFKRSFHNLKGDVDFDIAFNINNMINSNTNRETMNKKYYLKSIISLYQSNNGFKYFSDVCINGNWYRFCDNNDFNINIKNIYINDLKKFEPQMLIYELEDDNNQFNPFYNSFENKNIMTMMQLINMQLQMLQLKEFMQRVCNNASF